MDKSKERKLEREDLKEEEEEEEEGGGGIQ